MTRSQKAETVEGVQVRRCRKRLIRLILGEFAFPGALLPPQRKLRDILGASNDTISEAMRQLADDGVLTRKPRVGTVIRDIGRIRDLPWVLGVATIDAPSRGELSFFAYLLHALQVRLSQRGCSCRTYVRHRKLNPLYHQLNHFGGLEEDVERGDLDGLVVLTNLDHADWSALNKRRIPVCHAGLWGDAPCGALIDLLRFRNDAIAALRERGCRRISTVGHFEDEIEGVSVSRAFSGEDGSGVAHRDVHEGVESGRAFARRVLAEPKAQRPDGLVVLDDYVAAGMAAELTDVDALPLLAVLTHLQRPFIFEPSALRFELDIEELGRAAADRLWACLNGDSEGDAVVSIPPRLDRAHRYGFRSARESAIEVSRVPELSAMQTGRDSP